MVPETNTTPQSDEAARRLLDEAFDDATVPPRHRDDSPTPRYGDAPPVAQPGRPPMSQKATDDSVRMLCASVLTLAVGGAGTGLLWASGHADPTVMAVVCAAPPALVLAVSRVVRRLRETAEAAPPEHHHHYSGPVYQDHSRTSSKTTGLIARTRNTRH